METMKLQAIRSSLQAAENWKRKGQSLWVGRCLSSALLNYLSVAVGDYSDADLAIKWLLQERIPTLLDNRLDETARLVAEVDAGKLPSSTISGNYEELVFAHLAWLFEAWDLGERHVQIAVRHDVRELSTPFWSEYSIAAESLVVRREYRVGELELRGQQKYWMPYLYLIEVACKGAPLDDALAGIDRSFAIRNTDNDFKDDHYEIEGSGRHPVKWDFRRWSLVNYVLHRRSLGQ
jgi:hypothetical protein